MRGYLCPGIICRHSGSSLASVNADSEYTRKLSPWMENMMDHRMYAMDIHLGPVFYTLTYINVTKEDVTEYVPDFYKADHTKPANTDGQTLD